MVKRFDYGHFLVILTTNILPYSFKQFDRGKKIYDQMTSVNIIIVVKKFMSLVENI